MDIEKLLDLTAEVGYRLTSCGAETFRVEESMERILHTYQVKAEVFAIPNCLFVSAHTDDGKTTSRMRRIGEPSTDMDGVEHYSGLSRRICAQAPSLATAERWLEETEADRVYYGNTLRYAGLFLAAAGFCILFGGGIRDAVISGFCGKIAGLVESFLRMRRANLFFRTILASLLFSFPAYVLNGLGLVADPNTVVIGALMPLVPGLLFTNAMRDIIYGDMISSVIRILQVILVALAIAIGTAVAWNISAQLLREAHGVPVKEYAVWIQCCACFAACIGFSVMFNIHGKGFYLCALGGALTWLIYCLLLARGFTDASGYFWASAFAAVYAETMARIRKYPAISYLIISLVPLIPGSGLYYTMTCAVSGDMAGFADKGLKTVVLTGIMAVGVILVNTAVRLCGSRKQQVRCCGELHK